jgi:hypothetical protein
MILDQTVHIDSPLTRSSINISNSAYMDDTQWITNSQKKLEIILTIADAFYSLNNIKVNKEKSELIVRTPDSKNGLCPDHINKQIKLKFGKSDIDIKVKGIHDSMRIL